MQTPETEAAKTLLFDLDGTLVDSLDDLAASANFVRQQAGLPAADRLAVRDMLGDGARKLIERAIDGNPNGLTFDDVWEAYRDHYRDECTHRVELYPGVREALEHWQTTHALGVVTNKPASYAHRILEHLDLARYFGDVVIGGDTTPHHKPDPAPVLEALSRLGASPASALMIGDGPQDILSGRAAGTRTVAVLFGFRDEDVLRATEADEYWTAFGQTVS